MTDRRRPGRIAAALWRTVAVASLILTALLTAASANAADGPVSCKMGTFVVSVSNVDTAKKTFDAD